MNEGSAEHEHQGKAGHVGRLTAQDVSFRSQPVVLRTPLVLTALDLRDLVRRTRLESNWRVILFTNAPRCTWNDGASTMEMVPMPKSLEPFATDIFFLESDATDAAKKYPFYADGFAGVIYSKSTKPFYLQPRNKKLPDFYLYGQTIEPISLDVKGAFQLVCIRLYPFAVRILLDVDPKVLKDDCFDLRLVENVDTQGTLEKLRQTDDRSDLVDILAVYFKELLKHASNNADYRIKLATNLILKANGLMSIGEIRDILGVTERTLERHFLKEIGITAKQFAKVIQFSSAMKQMTEADYVKLTEIGYENGFADQSHFIRSFKRYTGKTPKEFQQELSV